MDHHAMFIPVMVNVAGRDNGHRELHLPRTILERRTNCTILYIAILWVVFITNHYHKKAPSQDPTRFFNCNQMVRQKFDTFGGFDMPNCIKLKDGN